MGRICISEWLITLLAAPEPPRRTADILPWRPRPAPQTPPASSPQPVPAPRG